ncbi:MAPEG family protein [Sphingorhabdus sp. SMR4y]|uniref:MAPEG family protein n=1 Tax=Sphingorhabdus sp. SMR4y TaxID=2584094 RepID=UPI000B5C2C8F|nr:MAPEG family protein [Sphingorhabdus sp. SMR4y]ASK87616.1 MAPEG family protein [Sphingorhabdus sp. SMR4y]
MENSPLLQPMVALILWTMLIWLWMYATRIPAMNKAKIDSVNLVGAKGGDLDELLPPEVQWKAHNYNHLLTEPTLFYAICVVLILSGQDYGLNLTIAWAYVALRVLHSLVQVTINRVIFRFLLFALSSLCIIALAIHAAIAVFH